MIYKVFNDTTNEPANCCLYELREDADRLRDYLERYSNDRFSVAELSGFGIAPCRTGVIWGEECLHCARCVATPEAREEFKERCKSRF